MTTSNLNHSINSNLYGLPQLGKQDNRLSADNFISRIDLIIRDTQSEPTDQQVSNLRKGLNKFFDNLDNIETAVKLIDKLNIKQIDFLEDNQIITKADANLIRHAKTTGTSNAAHHDNVNMAAYFMNLYRQNSPQEIDLTQFQHASLLPSGTLSNFTKEQCDSIKKFTPPAGSMTTTRTSILSIFPNLTINLIGRGLKMTDNRQATLTNINKLAGLKEDNLPERYFNKEEASEGFESLYVVLENGSIDLSRKNPQNHTKNLDMDDYTNISSEDSGTEYTSDNPRYQNSNNQRYRPFRTANDDQQRRSNNSDGGRTRSFSDSGNKRDGSNYSGRSGQANKKQLKTRVARDNASSPRSNSTHSSPYGQSPQYVQGNGGSGYGSGQQKARSSGGSVTSNLNTGNQHLVGRNTDHNNFSDKENMMDMGFSQVSPNASKRTSQDENSYKKPSLPYSINSSNVSSNLGKENKVDNHREFDLKPSLNIIYSTSTKRLGLEDALSAAKSLIDFANTGVDNPVTIEKFKDVSDDLFNATNNTAYQVGNSFTGDIKGDVDATKIKLNRAISLIGVMDTATQVVNKAIIKNPNYDETDLNGLAKRLDSLTKASKKLEESIPKDESSLPLNNTTIYQEATATLEKANGEIESLHAVIKYQSLADKALGDVSAFDTKIRNQSLHSLILLSEDFNKSHNIQRFTQCVSMKDVPNSHILTASDIMNAINETRDNINHEQDNIRNEISELERLISNGNKLFTEQFSRINQVQDGIDKAKSKRVPASDGKNNTLTDEKAIKTIEDHLIILKTGLGDANKLFGDAQNATLTMLRTINEKLKTQIEASDADISLSIKTSNDKIVILNALLDKGLDVINDYKTNNVFNDSQLLLDITRTIGEIPNWDTNTLITPLVRNRAEIIERTLNALNQKSLSINVKINLVKKCLKDNGHIQEQSQDRSTENSFNKKKTHRNNDLSQLKSYDGNA